MHAMHQKEINAMFLNNNHLQKCQGKDDYKDNWKNPEWEIFSSKRSDGRTDEKNTSRPTENVNNLTGKINPKIHSKPCSQQREFTFFFLFLAHRTIFKINQVLDFQEGNGSPLQYSCLENPMDRGAWWAAVHGVAKSQTRLNDFTFPFHFPALEKEMAAHSSVLAWRIPGMGEPGGLPSMGSRRVGHD